MYVHLVVVPAFYLGIYRWESHFGTKIHLNFNVVQYFSLLQRELPKVSSNIEVLYCHDIHVQDQWKFGHNQYKIHLSSSVTPFIL